MPKYKPIIYVSAPAVPGNVTAFALQTSPLSPVGVSATWGVPGALNVVVPPPFAAPLDAITATVKGAWSVFKLRSAYAGPTWRVRRDLDNAELDVGFAPSGLLDTGALLAFAGPGGTAWLTTWYDQSGAGRNLAQPTAAQQPLVVSAGALVTMATGNPRPAALFTPANATFLYRAGTSFGGGSFGAAGEAQSECSGDSFGRLLSFTASGHTVDYDDTASAILALYNSGSLSGFQGGFKAGQPLSGTAPFWFDSVFDGANHTMTVNGASSGPSGSSGTLAATGTLSLGTNCMSGTVQDLWAGRIAEAITWTGPISPADLATLRQSRAARF